MIKLHALQPQTQNHYATLGLDRRCTAEQIRDAYRLLAKQFHPDLNHGSRVAVEQTQALNSAYEVLGDPEKREAYDRELAAKEKSTRSRVSKGEQNLSEEVHLRIDEFLRGARREVHISDPGNPEGPELYDLTVPPETAPGTRFRFSRNSGGVLTIRTKVLPHFQFKARGSDLRCDLKINTQRARQGGEEMVTGATGNRIRVKIPSGVTRGEIIRIAGEGLPKPRGGRGDLLVRVMYRPEIRISRRTL